MGRDGAAAGQGSIGVQQRVEAGDQYPLQPVVEVHAVGMKRRVAVEGLWRWRQGVPQIEALHLGFNLL